MIHMCTYTLNSYVNTVSCKHKHELTQARSYKVQISFFENYLFAISYALKFGKCCKKKTGAEAGVLKLRRAIWIEHVFIVILLPLLLSQLRTIGGCLELVFLLVFGYQYQVSSKSFIQSPECVSCTFCLLH